MHGKKGITMQHGTTDILDKLLKHGARMGTRDPNDYTAFLSVAEVMEAANEIQKLRDKVADLEYVLADLPGYIDDWSWMRKNFDILKTVPNFPFYSELAQKLKEEKNDTQGTGRD